MSSAGRLEPWKIKEVRKYLEREFPGSRARSAAAMWPPCSSY